MIKSMKNGDVKLCHSPNKSLCWTVKNKIGQVLVFEFGTNHGYPPKIAQKFANSHNEW
jgi:hypothetical protein